MANVVRLFSDGLKNLISGLGVGGRDKTLENQFTFTPVTQNEVEYAYRGDWLARKIVDTIPFDMTREWISWKAKSKQTEKIETLCDTMCVQHKTMLALSKARLYGGAGIYLGLKGTGKPDTELKIEQVKADSLKYLHVLHRYELKADMWETDIESPYFHTPKMYELASVDGGAPVLIHPSRFIRFSGAPLPDIRNQSDGWDDSILQVVFDAIKQAVSTPQYINTMLPEAKLDVLSVPGLSEQLSTDEGTRKVQARFQNAAYLRSMLGLLLIEGDKDGGGEQYQQKQINFQQFPDLIRQFLEIACGAADYTVLRLLGKQPSGLNASGEGEIRSYYDGVASKQKVELKPRLDFLLDVVMASALGKVPDEAYYTFNPLWQLTAKEQAEVGKLEAETDKIYVDTATVPNEVLQIAIKNRLIEFGRYPGIEQIYQDYEDGKLELMIAPTPAPAFETNPDGTPKLGPDGKPIPIVPDPNAPPVDPNAPPAKPGKVVPFKKKTASGDALQRLFDQAARHTDATPQQVDPTGTLRIRQRYEADMVRRFQKIKSQIREAIVQLDVLGLKTPSVMSSTFLKSYSTGDFQPDVLLATLDAPARQAFAFNRSSEKVSSFMNWLKDAEREGILGVSPGTSMQAAAETAWQNTYIDTAYQKGIRDAGNKLDVAGASLESDFISGAFNRPVHADAAGLLYTRAFNELDGVTDAMSQRISRSLAQGLIEGLGPMDIARSLAADVDEIGIMRARLIARVETIHAHAEGALNLFEEAKVEGVEIEAEYSTAGDEQVCPDCAEYEGRVITIDEAHGLIPMHPNCRCTFIPIVKEPAP